MKDFMKEFTYIKCYCGSSWVNVYPISRKDKLLRWFKWNILGDATARYIYGPYMVVCSKCKKRRRELEKRDYATKNKS